MVPPCCLDPSSRDAGSLLTAASILKFLSLLNKTRDRGASRRWMEIKTGPIGSERREQTSKDFNDDDDDDNNELR